MANNMGGGGSWVTINGTHVFIQGGKITKGPKHLVGKTPKQAEGGGESQKKSASAGSTTSGKKTSSSAKKSTSKKSSAQRGAGQQQSSGDSSFHNLVQKKRQAFEAGERPKNSVTRKAERARAGENGGNPNPTDIKRGGHIPNRHRETISGDRYMESVYQDALDQGFSYQSALDSAYLAKLDTFTRQFKGGMTNSSSIRGKVPVTAENAADVVRAGNRIIKANGGKMPTATKPNAGGMDVGTVTQRQQMEFADAFLTACNIQARKGKK